MARKKVAMFPADSSNVAAYGYQKREKRLFIRFRNGETYCYLVVPEHVYEGIRQAPSIGTYVNQSIKPVYQAVNVGLHPDLQEEVQFVEQGAWVSDDDRKQPPRLPAVTDPRWAW